MGRPIKILHILSYCFAMTISATLYVLNLQSADEDRQRLLSSSASSGAAEERRKSAAGASSSRAGCLGVVQEGFAEGVISLKEAAAYISRSQNR